MPTSPAARARLIAEWGDLADFFSPDEEPSLSPSTAPIPPSLPPPTPPPLPSWVPTPVSTNVRAIIYWPTGTGPSGATLGVQFLSGSEYHYWDVPRAVYAALLARECIARDGHQSHGATHWQRVRDRYPFRMMTAAIANWRQTSPFALERHLAGTAPKPTSRRPKRRS